MATRLPRSEVFFISSRRSRPEVTSVYDRSFIGRRRLLPTRRAIKTQHPTALVTINYHEGYEQLLWALPRTPVIVWVRDPRTPKDHERVATVRMPGKPDVIPVDLEPWNTLSLGRMYRLGRSMGRRIAFAAPALSHAEKLQSAYGFDPPLQLLPNPIEPADSIAPSTRPVVTYLGRHDPVKRPWLFVELARRIPDAQFVLTGQAHFEGPRAWRPDRVPDNVEIVGHLDEPAKRELLSRSWIVVNTSVHEALPVSILEGFAFEAPIVALLDLKGVVSRFGRYVGDFLGDGMDAVDPLVATVEELLGNDRLRTDLGRAARQWIEEVHSPAAFDAALRRIHAQVSGK